MTKTHKACKSRRKENFKCMILLHALDKELSHYLLFRLFETSLAISLARLKRMRNNLTMGILECHNPWPLDLGLSSQLQYLINIFNPNFNEKNKTLVELQFGYSLIQKS